jgi:hypothetical protein
VALVRTDVSEELSASFLQEPHGITPPENAFFIFTAVKTSYLTTVSLYSISEMIFIMETTVVPVTFQI